MKLFILKLKFFFSQPEVKLFFRVFSVSLPIAAVISIVAYPYINSIFESNRRARTYEQFYDIVTMPRTTNNTVILEDSHFLDTNKIDMPEDKNFWTGDAMNYRYLNPIHGN